MMNETAQIYARSLDHTDLGVPAHMEDQVYAKARIDNITLGCTAVKSNVRLNPSGSLRGFSMTYWYRLPNNMAQHINLFDIETLADGMPSRIAVAGRLISLSDPKAVEAAMQAIRHIHEDLKDSRYPNIALAFQENDLARHVGKNIKIVGQKPSGEADFTFTPFFNFHADGGLGKADLAIPSDPDMFKALLGLSVNPLRPDLDVLQSRLRVVPAYEALSQVTYENRLQTLENRYGGLRMHMATHKRGAAAEDTAEVYRDLFRVETRGGAKPGLSELVLMGQNMKGKGHAAQAQALGAVAGMADAFARHAAPVPLTHLVNYDLRGLMSDPQIVAQLQGIEKPFLRISLAGNRYTKIYGPYGNDLGNCKLLMYGGVTVMHDFALKPAPDGEKSNGAIATITDWLPNLDALCVTHKHIDHAGGIPYEDFRKVPMLATPQVIEDVKDSMRTLHGSKAKDRMPQCVPLLGNGHHTISKDGGKSGITILYSPNATPHTAYCTPFYYAAFDTKPNGRKYIVGVYANLGDTRDEDNVADWWFRTGWRESLMEAHPDLDPLDAPAHPTFAEWDSTSVRYKGATPTRAEVLENMKMAVSWFDGYTILDAHLASSDNQFDIMVQSAADSGRDFTTFGKNMEKTQRIQNIFGYSELNEPWPQGHQNQIHMDKVHAQNLQTRLDALAQYMPSKAMIHLFESDMEFDHAEGMALKGDARKNYEDGLESGRSDDFDHYVRWKKAEEKIEEGEADEVDEIAAQMHRLYLFRNWLSGHGHEDEAKYVQADLTRVLHQRLTRYSNNYWRFRRRKQYASAYNVDKTADLGPLSITRATMTSAMMFRENLQRMFVALTGSQGNEVEVEAQLPKLLEKRALLTLDPRYRHTARPIDPKKSVLFISQPVIVGNDKARLRLVHKAAREFGMVVVNSTHDGFEIYNSHHLGPETLKKIRADLGARGVVFREESIDHRLVVTSPMPLGYRGHGRLEDMLRWMRRTQAEVNAPNHINDPEAAKEIEIISRSLHQGWVPLIEDFEISAIDRFAKDPAEKVRVLGSIPAGITILHLEQPNQKPYRQVLHKNRVVVLEPERKAGLLQPLMAGCRARTDILRDFGPVTPPDDRDIRITDVSKERVGSRPAPSDLMRMVGSETWTPRPPVIPVPVPGLFRAVPRSIELV